MIGKATLGDFPKAKRPINKPLYQVHMDSFSSLFKFIEGYNGVIVFVDAATGYRWIYGLKSKDDVIKALRKWYSDITDLRTKQNLVVLMRDNASGYKSEEMMQFLESRGIRSHFSTPKEQWQNGAAESTINSIMMSAQTVMAESGLGERLWLRQARMPKT
jgi:transposase InsO family protein